MNSVSPNVWKTFESFEKLDAETHRILLCNAVGHDLNKSFFVSNLLLSRKEQNIAYIIIDKNYFFLLL